MNSLIYHDRKVNYNIVKTGCVKNITGIFLESRVVLWEIL